MRTQRIHATVILTLIALAGAATAQSETGIVAALRGTLQIQRGGAWQSGSIGAPVFAGDRLRTGAGDQARVVFRDDSLLDLAPGTEVLLLRQVLGETGRHFDSQLRLAQGKLRAWVSDAYHAAHSRYEIETPTAIAILRGTELVVAYDPAAEVTQVICMTGEVEVTSTLAIMGRNVQLGPQARSQVAKGRFPAAAERLDSAQAGEAVAGVDLVGTGHRDGLSVDHPGISGRLWAPQDVPGPPSAALAARAGTEGIAVRGLQESLAEQLSPDVRANTQPLLEFKFAPPDQVPPGTVTAHF